MHIFATHFWASICTGKNFKALYIYEVAEILKCDSFIFVSSSVTPCSLQRIYWFFNDTHGWISVFFYKKISFSSQCYGCHSMGTATTRIAE